MTELNDLKREFEVVNQLKQQVSQNQTEQKLKFEAARAKLRDRVRAYFSQRLIETKGELTAELMREVDAVYDIAGLPSTIAEALQITVFEIQDLLVRDKQVPCSKCKTPVKVKTRRCVGGYTEPKRDLLCSKCKKERRLYWQEEWDEKREAIGSWLQVDRLLQVADRPLRVTGYYHHLYNFFRCWIKGEWRRVIGQYEYRFADVAGCMVCGSHLASLYLIQENSIPPDSMFYRVLTHDARALKASQAVEFNGIIAPLETYHQALWSMQPGNYFADYLFCPLLERPLVCLCPECGALVESTHRLIEFPNPPRLLSYEVALRNLDQFIPSSDQWLYIYGSIQTEATRQFLDTLVHAYERPFFQLHLSKAMQLGQQRINDEDFDKATRAELLIISGFGDYRFLRERNAWNWDQLGSLIGDRVEHRRHLILWDSSDSLQALSRHWDRSASPQAINILKWFENRIIREISLQPRQVVIEERLRSTTKGS